MSLYFYFAFVLSLVVICESAFVDTLQKCHIDNKECQRKSIENVISKMGNGIPEYNIPPIDPYHVKNIKVSILELVDIIFDGVVKGITNCVVNKYERNLEDGECKLEITCDILVKGQYKLFSKSPLINNLFGGESIHGDGDAKVKLDQLKLFLVIPYDIVKRGDGVYFIGKKDKFTYTYDVGKVTVKVNKLYLGEMEASESIMNIVNGNSKELVKSFGKNIFDVAADFVFEFTNRYISSVPTKSYIIEDLSGYVKNK